MAAVKSPMMIPLQQTPSLTDCFQLSVAATFFQAATVVQQNRGEPPSDEDEEEEQEETEEEVESEDYEDSDTDEPPPRREDEEENTHVDVTIPIRTPRPANSTQATVIRKISAETVEADGVTTAPTVTVTVVEASDDEPSSGAGGSSGSSRDSGRTISTSSSATDKASSQEPDEEVEEDGPEIDYLTVEDALASGPRTLERVCSRSVELEPNELVDKINQYERISTVGKGTFGRVILVQHRRQTGSYFALKLMGIRDVIRNRQIEHVHSEKNILLRVDHPFIIKLHWAYHDTKFLYMLFDYVPGGELFSYLRCARRFANHTARFYTAEIVLALEYLHQEHVVYRDLKPENILLDKDGHVRLTDFGFSKHVAEGRTFTMCGTPEYLAPEIVAGKGHNTAVDWWSLGILVYEMLVGRTPFPGDESRIVYNQILESPKPIFPKGLDPAAKDLVRRLLVVDRVKRLGNLKGGASDVKTHKWFIDTNWWDVYEKKLTPPIRPTVNGEGDTGNFDEYDEDNSSECSEATPDDLELFEDW